MERADVGDGDVDGLQVRRIQSRLGRSEFRFADAQILQRYAVELRS